MPCLSSAIITEATLSSAQEEDREEDERKSRKRQFLVVELRKLFLDLDQDKSGSIVREEFKMCVTNPLIASK